MNQTNGNSTIAFFGTPQFATVVLDELKAAGILPSLIITRPDRPKGRNLVMTSPEVAVWAWENGIEYVQPEKLDRNFIACLRPRNFDLFLIVAYGKIVPKEIIDMPAHGTLNVHPSLLPRLRGASPIESAILLENKTGTTIMHIDEEMDHGPIVAQKKVVVPEWPPRASELEAILADESGKLLAKTIPAWIAGKITPRAQEHAKATYCKKIVKEDGLIDLSDDPEKNYRKIRAFDKWPRAHFFTERHGKKIRVTITDAILADGTLVVKRVIPEGKREMSYDDFLIGTSA